MAVSISALRWILPKKYGMQAPGTSSALLWFQAASHIIHRLDVFILYGRPPETPHDGRRTMQNTGLVDEAHTGVLPLAALHHDPGAVLKVPPPAPVALRGAIRRNPPPRHPLPVANLALVVGPVGVGEPPFACTGACRRDFVANRGAAPLPALAAGFRCAFLRRLKFGTCGNTLETCKSECRDICCACRHTPESFQLTYK